MDEAPPLRTVKAPCVWLDERTVFAGGGERSSTTATNKLSAARPENQHTPRHTDQYANAYLTLNTYLSTPR